MSIRNWPVSERPRERLQQLGPGVLSHAELLALLIDTGHARSGLTAIDLARSVLSGSEGSLRNLAAASLEELMKWPGIGPAKAVRIQAAVELGRRLAAEPAVGNYVNSPEDAARLLLPEMQALDVEEFRILSLSTKNGLIASETISVGVLDSTLVRPREVYRAALRRNAARVILAHNHPSGDPTPSPEDKLLTRRLNESGRLLGVEVLDHLVIGYQRFVSLRRQEPTLFSGSWQGLDEKGGAAC